MDQQNQDQDQDQDEANRREREGVRLGLDWAMDIIGQGEAGQAAAQASIVTEVNRGPFTASPRRSLTHVSTP